jgi:hypothetical protein
MTVFNKLMCHTYTSAAKSLGVSVWRLRYAVESGYLPRPIVRFKLRAMFAPGQIEWMRAYFAHLDSGTNGDRLDTAEAAELLGSVRATV